MPWALNYIHPHEKSNPWLNIKQIWSSRIYSLDNIANSSSNLTQIAPYQKALASLQVFWNHLDDPELQSQLGVVAMQFTWRPDYSSQRETQRETQWRNCEILTVLWSSWGWFAPPVAHDMFVRNRVCLSSLPNLKFHQWTLWPFWKIVHIMKENMHT